jgi:hypothetical protein
MPTTNLPVLDEKWHLGSHRWSTYDDCGELRQARASQRRVANQSDQAQASSPLLPDQQDELDFCDGSIRATLKPLTTVGKKA